MLKNNVEVGINKLTISVRKYFSFKEIGYLLDSASRGSRYWSDSEQLGFENTIYDLLNLGKEIKIHDFEEEKDYFLDLKSVKRGLTVMAKKESIHYADFIKGDYDQTTGDVFLQCCLFGEVIYG